MIQPAEQYHLPELHEHDFRSTVPIVGPLISFVRRLLYNLTAKWGVWAIIQQQNRINQMMMELILATREQIRHQEKILIDVDRDLAALARTVAEIEVRQRHLVRMLSGQCSEQNPDEG
ncbi:MAG: hypothetical protein H5T61_10265 [Thermoflexales bacterium]|nr:hypothetical protein [Thermoflexales bacterium]